MFFETSAIYRVDPDERCLEPRHGSVLVNKDLDQYEARLPLWVGGVDRSDLAIFGTALNEGGLTDLDLLVIDSTTFRGSAYVAPPWIIEAFPDLQTMELAKKFTTLEEGELAKLGIQGLVNVMRARYPGVKGLRRH